MEFERIPKEKFEFAQMDKDIHDKKLETKTRSFFADAMIRFKKNKSSVVAAWISVPTFPMAGTAMAAAIRAANALLCFLMISFHPNPVFSFVSELLLLLLHMHLLLLHLVKLILFSY